MSLDLPSGSSYPRIKEVDFKEAEKSATVHFEKASAAKTALMLNGGTLDGSHLTVTSEYEHQDDDDASPTAEGVPYHQSDKPRAGSEYSAALTCRQSPTPSSYSCCRISRKGIYSLGSDPTTRNRHGQ